VAADVVVSTEAAAPLESRGRPAVRGHFARARHYRHAADRPGATRMSVVAERLIGGPSASDGVGALHRLFGLHLLTGKVAPD
jgi:hypothetical protein